MKLAELKSALVDQFFTASSGGVSSLELPEVYAALAKALKVDVSTLTVDTLSEGLEGISSDPSKGFKKFTESRRVLLAIMEDDKAIFAAARVGKNVVYTDLTVELREEKKGDLAVIKNALKQAKNINDDAYFNITNRD